VALDGGVADDQLGGDLGVGQPAGDQLEDLPLPVGEALEALERVGGAGWGEPGELLDHPAGDRGGQQRVPGGDHPDRADELLGRGALEQEAARACREGLIHVLVQVEGGQDHHPGPRARRQELLGGLQAVQVRHPDVHQHHLGPQPPGGGDRLDAVAGLAHHLDVGLGLQDHPEPRPDQLLVVGQQHPEVMAPRPGAAGRPGRRSRPGGGGPAAARRRTAPPALASRWCRRLRSGPSGLAARGRRR
jgi:hypothetical protein